MRTLRSSAGSRAALDDRLLRAVDETRAGVLAVIARLEAQEAIEAVILGGTELPLLLRDAEAAVPMLDTTSIHVDAAIERLLEP
jgi:aspartate racemase